MTKLYRYIPKICFQCKRHYLAGFYKTKFCGAECQAKARVGIPNLSAIRDFCVNGHDLSVTRKTQINGKKYCSKCSNLRNRPYRLKKYGLTEDSFNTLLKAQSDQCSICKSKTHNSKNWHIDHDHKTGKVRSLLCGNCNTMLGQAKESTSILLEGVKYLERHNEVGGLVGDWSYDHEN